MNQKTITLLFSLFNIYGKPVLAFFASLYLIGFSFNGVNVFGYVDDLIPLERSLCFMVGLLFMAYSVEGYVLALRYTKKTWSKPKNEKN